MNELKIKHTIVDCPAAAEDVLQLLGASISYEKRNIKTPPWLMPKEKWLGSHYEVSLESKDGLGYTFDFFVGYPDWEPNAYDVLASLNWTIYTFDEFCDEFGYSNDSIRARKMWISHRSQAKALRRVFPDERAQEILSHVL